MRHSSALVIESSTTVYWSLVFTKVRNTTGPSRWANSAKEDVRLPTRTATVTQQSGSLLPAVRHLVRSPEMQTARSFIETAIRQEMTVVRSRAFDPFESIESVAYLMPPEKPDQPFQRSKRAN